MTLPMGLRAAGVDPAERVPREKIPSDAAEAEAGEESEEEPEEAETAGSETAEQADPDKEWPTPLPQKMTIGREEEVRKHLNAKNWAEAAILLKSILDE